MSDLSAIFSDAPGAQESFAEYLASARPLVVDRRFASMTYLYRYFSRGGRLLYVGITCDPATRNWQHRSAVWFSVATLVRYELFPSRNLALIAESIAIEDEGPDFNYSVRLQVREWPVRDEWYRAETGGRFIGLDPAWYAVDRELKGGRVGPPSWWAQGFRQDPNPRMALGLPGQNRPE